MPTLPPRSVLALALLVGACSAAPDPRGSGAAVTRTIDAAGGELAVEGATLTIPAGALAAPTEITVTATTGSAPAGYTALSPVFRFEPDGLAFAQPVAVSLPWGGDPAGAAIHWSRADGGFERLASTVDGTTMKASVEHFCQGFVGRESPVDGGTGPDPHATPVGIAGGCALASDGTVRCWSAGHDQAPVALGGFSGATQLAAGAAHHCARMSDATVRCWGGANYGPTPTAVPDLAGVAQIAARGDYTCARLDDGAVKCWGGNEFGQLGNGGSTALATPFTVPLGEAATEIALGTGHACARTASGGVWCWGSNMGGELGNGGPRTRYNPPGAVPDLAGVQQIAAGSVHSCARLADSVVCWGLMLVDYGGTLIEAPQSTPLAIAGLGAASALALGDGYSCALLPDRGVRCWGRNGYGQLGDGTTQDRVAPTAGRATDVELLAVSGEFSCARKRDGSLWGWGRVPAPPPGCVLLPEGGCQPFPEPVRMAW